MSPTETLRAAATKLRETASKATPGPRKVGRIAGIGQCVSAPDLKFCVAVESGWVSKGDAAWIALMSPAVAEPLAAWLEREAEHAKDGIVRDAPECPSCGEGCGGHDEQDFHDGTDDRGGCNRPLGGPDDHCCACFDEPLAFARSILGRQS